MKKQGAELSMNVIIIAAIGLLVLIILAVLVINAGGRTQTGVTTSCNALGGLCKTAGSCGNAGVYTDATGCSTGMDCCKLFAGTS